MIKYDKLTTKPKTAQTGLNTRKPTVQKSLERIPQSNISPKNQTTQPLVSKVNEKRLKSPQAKPTGGLQTNQSALKTTAKPTLTTANRNKSPVVQTKVTSKQSPRPMQKQNLSPPPQKEDDGRLTINQITKDSPKQIAQQKLDFKVQSKQINIEESKAETPIQKKEIAQSSIQTLQVLPKNQASQQKTEISQIGHGKNKIVSKSPQSVNLNSKPQLNSNIKNIVSTDKKFSKSPPSRTSPKPQILGRQSPTNRTSPQGRTGISTQISTKVNNSKADIKIEKVNEKINIIAEQEKAKQAYEQVQKMEYQRQLEIQKKKQEEEKAMKKEEEFRQKEQQRQQEEKKKADEIQQKQLEQKRKDIERANSQNRKEESKTEAKLNTQQRNQSPVNKSPLGNNTIQHQNVKSTPSNNLSQQQQITSNLAKNRPESIQQESQPAKPMAIVQKSIQQPISQLKQEHEENYHSDFKNQEKQVMNQFVRPQNSSPKPQQLRERESFILRQCKERDSMDRNILIIGADDNLNRVSQSSYAGDDVDENPFQVPLHIKTVYNNNTDDNRFSIHQIQMNLLSSLGDTQNRESFISRASNKLNKNNNTSSKSSILTKRQKGNTQYSQYGDRCSKCIPQMLNCLYSERSKNDNNSVYSDGNKINTFYFQGSNPLQRESSSQNIKTEEWDEMDDDIESSEMRQNINATAIQPRIMPTLINAQINNMNPDKPMIIIQQQQVSSPTPKKNNQNKLDQFVTKVSQNGQMPQIPQQNQPVRAEVNLATSQQTVTQIEQPVTSTSGIAIQSDHHKVHFLQTLQALHNIMNNITMPSDEEIEHQKLNLPPIRDPKKKKTLIFDMDETLIHCVDDADNDNPQVLIPILFPDEVEPINAGVNIRPYIYECLEEANKYFQVGVFTASHKAYADAILDYIDPENKYFAFRYYRDNCVQTREGYYIKDLRIFQNRDLKDIIIIDNSVYSFAFHIDNGIPIIPFYADKEDEEMLHLIYYLNCLYEADDVRVQNKEAFELHKLAQQSIVDIMNQQNMFNQMGDDSFEEEFKDNDIREETEENEDHQDHSQQKPIKF